MKTVEAKKYTVEVPVQFTSEELIDIVSGAIETGIGYWAGISRVFACGTDINQDRDIMEDIYSEWLGKHILEGKGVIIFDKEDPEDKAVLTLPKLLNGIKLHHKNNPNADKEMYDASDYDCIIQYALFEEVVFG